MIRLAWMGLLSVVAMVASGAEAQQSFRDCAKCPELVTIPANTFQMGPAPGEEEREGVPAELRIGSTHGVKISAFAIGKYEITKTEYEAFVTATNHPDGSCSGDKDRNWRRPGFAQTERDPVVCVSWIDAMAYVSWLTKETGKAYRLPSEAEWEYAARAGTQTARYWGDSRQEACSYGNFADLTYGAAENAKPSDIFLCTDGFVRTAPVGRFKPNAFGLYDMLGNAWEWTADCWNGKYDNASTDNRAWETGNCDVRVLRGGSWGNYPRGSRAAARGISTAGVRGNSYGFRVARTN